MFHQTIVGKPKHCLNRNCKHPFFKESHLGWLPKSEVEVYTIMRCLACKDTFAVIQLISMAHEYKEKLPLDPTQIPPTSPISKKVFTLVVLIKSSHNGCNFFQSKSKSADQQKISQFEASARMNLFYLH